MPDKIIDSALGIHSVALRLRALRTKIIASNLANADTPNYKARDIDFKEAFSRAKEAGDLFHMAVIHKGHIRPESQGNLPDLLYRNPVQPSLDENTVDSQAEIAAFTQNALQYQASLAFLKSRIGTLLTAIKGE